MTNPTLPTERINVERNVLLPRLSLAPQGRSPLCAGKGIIHKGGIRIGKWKLLLSASEQNVEEAPSDDISESKDSAVSRPVKIRRARAS